MNDEDRRKRGKSEGAMLLRTSPHFSLRVPSSQRHATMRFHSSHHPIMLRVNSLHKYNLFIFAGKRKLIFVQSRTIPPDLFADAIISQVDEQTIPHHK